ncbi:MAG: glycosyltransferase [Prevotella sp.]|nr:glycosyltransferase [Prevotella sp.]
MNSNERRFSVIMTIYEQAHELEEHLPAFLTQHYESEYDVVVVDESSTDESPDVLKLLKNEYNNLYTTFLPKPDRHVVRKKQAYNIGIRAAKGDWLILTSIDKYPVSDDDLQSISDTMDDSADLTLGYFTKKGIKLQAFAEYAEAEDHIIRMERRQKKQRNRKKCNYRWGRYDFIIVRRDVVVHVLKFYELQPSFMERQAMRWRIFWKNLTSKNECIAYLPKE